MRYIGFSPTAVSFHALATTPPRMMPPDDSSTETHSTSPPSTEEVDAEDVDIGASVPMSYEPIATSRLIPRVSFRSLFVLTTVMAVLYAVAKSAEEGMSAAISVLVVLGYLAAMMVLFMALYCVAWAFAILFARRDTDVQEGSPFASDQLPPQWIAPREKEA